jgi:2-hydroxymuconate-semialdehyde hydrolase
VTKLREFDVPFEGTTMHCWDGGEGFPLIFLHGSGTGAQTMSNFKRVLDPLAARYRVIAADLIGYGQSGMRPIEPYFDMDMWVRQAEALIAMVPEGPVGLIGHSLSGSIVLKAAAANKRVSGVIGTASFGVSYPIPAGTRGWPLPDSKEALRQGTLRTVYDPSFVEDAEIERRWATLSRPGYREYFAKMYPEERQHYLDVSSLSDEELARIGCPVLLMHGANDASFGPERTSLILQKKLPRADVFVLNHCGHSVALEHAEAFMAMVDLYFGVGCVGRAEPTFEPAITGEIGTDTVSAK